MPDDTSRRSERVPAKEHPLAKKNFDQGLQPENEDPHKPGTPATAVRQDAGLGDTSTRDETRR